MKKAVCVTGASSQLGVFLLPRLSAAGFRVLAVSRKARATETVGAETVCWVPPDHQAGPSGQLVSCGPLDLAQSLLAQNREIRRLVAFSTTSVLTKADSVNRQEREIISRIRSQEHQLRELCETRGVGLTLIRPTLIYGCGLDRTISLMARFGRRFGFIPVSRGAEGLRQPVHADDLADLAVRCLLSESAIGLESAACGGSTLSYREMMEKTAAACGRKVRILPLDPRLLAVAASLAALLPGYRGVNPEMVKRQGRDMVFDDSTWRKNLGYCPRAFDPAPADFEIPESARNLQLSR
jgi:nucleoside-diphosphate-sugar epimerase